VLLTKKCMIFSYMKYPRQNNRAPKPERIRRSPKNHNSLVIFGRHSVGRLLATYPLMTTSVMVREDLLAEYRDLARNMGYKGPVHVARDAELDKKARGGIHQGVVAEMPGFPYAPIESISKDSKMVLILDQIQDPQNMGALIRSALAFDCSAVIVGEHEQSEVTGVVARSSAGALFDIPIVKVTNISNAITELKEKGFWVVGMAGDSSKSLDSFDFDARTAIVMGSEGDGIRPGVAKACDALLSIPMSNKVESLNVSVAAGIVLSHVFNKLQK
jgi:23S rRNA (guanosine2251-2'-O)-methyltransferase